MMSEYPEGYVFLTTLSKECRERFPYLVGGDKNVVSQVGRLSHAQLKEIIGSWNWSPETEYNAYVTVWARMESIRRNYNREPEIEDWLSWPPTNAPLREKDTRCNDG